MPPKSNRSFLIDENTSRSLTAALRTMGHIAEHVYEAGLQGHTDPDIFAYAQEHKQTIITCDLDFSNILQYPPPHAGIMVLRLATNAPANEIIQEVQNALQALAEEDFANTLFIVEKGRVRIRR